MEAKLNFSPHFSAPVLCRLNARIEICALETGICERGVGKSDIPEGRIWLGNRDKRRSARFFLLEDKLCGNFLH